MLQADIRDLHRGPVETVGRLEPGDPTFTGLDLQLDGPVEVRGRLQQTGERDFFWHATVQGRVSGACRRCLKELAYPFDTEVQVLLSADPETADDPSVYLLPEPVTAVDVRPVIREEVALAVSRFPLCREDCAGLCPRCGADLNAGPCGCAGPAEPD
jgi:DUF177 domain-containing protein